MSINLASIEVPELKPARVKKQDKDWVCWGGQNNTFPQVLISAVDKSPEHAGFIELRQSLITGEGFSYSDNIKDVLANIHNLTGSEKVKDEPQSANDFLAQQAGDISILEKFDVEVTYNKTQDRIFSLHYLPASQVVPSKQVDERNQPLGYWYSADWSDQQNNPPVYRPRFDPRKPEEKVQIYSWCKLKTGNPYQPHISYQSALNYIEMMYHLSEYGLSTVINGFFAGGILETVANMDKEQKEKYSAKVKENFTGTKNSAKIMVAVTETPGQVKFTPLTQGDQTPLINALNDLGIDKICSAHRGNPSLAGIVKGGASLGGDGNNYSISLQIYEQTVIRGFKNAILNFMKRVLDFNGYQEYTIDITSLAVISTQMPESMMADYLKPEKIVSEYGYKEEDLRPELLTPKQPAQPAQNTPPAPNEQDQGA